MARISYLSPQPPARTGIATYSAQVLSGLREVDPSRRLRIDAPWPLGGRVDELMDAGDLAVYHIGNNAEFHGEIYRLAARRPGLVVLHDLAIDDLVRWLGDVGDPLGRRAEAAADAARIRLFERRPDVAEPLDTPWCADLVRRSRGVIVHSTFGRAYLKAFGSRTPVFVVPHPVIAPAQRAAERGGRIRATFPQPLLVGVLGDLGGAKGIETVLDAAGRLGDDVAVAVVGRRIPGYDAGEVVEASGIGRVRVAVDVSDRDFHAWLHAVDVVVNLRHPHRGEVSGTVVRALAAGKPVVVQATGTYLDWPWDAVVRVPGGAPDPETLAAALEGLRDPEARARLGARAREETDRLVREGATTAGYTRAIEETLALTRDPARLAVARWAGGLAQLGAGEEHASLATAQVEALEEMASAPVPGVRWEGEPGRYGEG